jgi:phosphoribosyl 1,2-cyclic phosphodiesterase
MLECGLPWKQIQKALKFKTSDICGVLVSHEHGDHSKGLKDAAKAGMDIYTSLGTAEAINIHGHRINHIKSNGQFKIQDWIVYPFDVVHDAAEPLGFFIVNGQDRLLFLTDTSYCKYKFTGITQLVIEANFSNEILTRNIKAGRVEKSREKRLLESHMSLERVKDFLNKNDLSKLQEIYLIHLSSANSDEELFKREVQGLTGIPTYICKE